MLTKPFIIGLVSVVSVFYAHAQQKLHFYRNDGKYNVYATNDIDSITVADDRTYIHINNGALFDVKNADIKEIKIGEQCEVAQMNITTTPLAPIISKDDYINCRVIINGKGMFPDFYSGARIRGRGNSTWLWYPKKPYRIKLENSLPMMGLPSNKDWVLLANYRDPTFLMNAFAFELADYLSVPFANNTRFVEVTLNGEMLGLYHLTEQVETGGNRVDIDEMTDVLLCLDVDDRSEDAADGKYDETFQSIYNMPVCIKSPEDEALTAAVKADIQADFAVLELLIQNHNYAAVSRRLDMQSLFNFLIIQEMTMNVELAAPRSMYMYRTADRVWHFGPPWDFDAGFCFDWNTMTTGHNYFANYNQLIFGAKPAERTSGWSGIPMFFRDMFNSAEFVAAFQSYWNLHKMQLLPQTIAKLDNYRWQIEAAMERNYTMWHAADQNFNREFSTEYPRLLLWLKSRFNILDYAINHYPPGS